MALFSHIDQLGGGGNSTLSRAKLSLAPGQEVLYAARQCRASCGRTNHRKVLGTCAFEHNTPLCQFLVDWHRCHRYGTGAIVMASANFFPQCLTWHRYHNIDTGAITPAPVQ